MRTIEWNRLERLGELLQESVHAGQIAGGNLCVVHKGEEDIMLRRGMQISQVEKR